MFKDSLNTKTRGRYYFSPPGTPFVSVAHHYGSRVWFDGNYEIIEGLGEDRTSKQSWDRGDEPAVLPNNVLIGDDSCLTDGANYAKRLDHDGLRNGFAIACYAPEVPLDPYWEIASSWDVCSLQFFYATIVKWMYLQDVMRIRFAFWLLLGPLAEVIWIRHTGIFPDIVIVKMPKFTIVVLDGTDNFQQLAMQAFAGISSPQNFGTYSTYPFWYASSTYVDERLTAYAVNPLRPIMLVGHSHGAVTLDNLAVRYLEGNPERVVRTMTFGAPKPGDERMQEILTRAMGISIANEDDIVTSTPPSRLVIFPVAQYLLRPDLFLWENWFEEPNRARMNFDGELRFNIDPTIDGALLRHMVIQIALGQPFDIVQPHFITEYRLRIERRCGQTEWPVSQPLWVWLHDLPYDPGRVGLPSPILAPMGGIGLAENVGKLCPCCPETLSPVKFTLRLGAPGYWFNGLTIQVEENAFTEGCFWLGVRVEGIYSFSAGALSDIATPSIVLTGFGFRDSTNSGWESLFSDMTITTRTCSPWFYVATGEIFLVTNEVRAATGDFATLTVISVP